jgi:2-methylcitrate dehydratase PrpD
MTTNKEVRKMISNEISKLVEQTRLVDIPDEVINYTKKLILSFLGGAIAGSVQPAGKILSRYISQKGGVSEAGVIGCRFRAPVTEAILANGTFAHASELEDDGTPEICVMYTLIAPMLNLGEKLRSSGGEVLESIIIGYQVQAATSLATEIPWGKGHGFFAFGPWGTVAGAAKLLRLEGKQINMAFSIAASMLSGLAGQTGSMTHLFECGFGGSNGVLAALLAREGFTGIPDIIEKKGGLWDTYGFPRGGLEMLSKLLAERPFHVMHVGIKKYSCCYIEQRVIDGVIELKEEHKISYEDIDGIEVHVGPYFPTLVRYSNPVNGDEARFSIEHSVAAVFLEKERVFLEAYTDEKALDPNYKEARQKVKVIVHPEWTAGVMGTIGGFEEVIVKVKDGKVYNKKCEKAKGDPPLYLSEEEVLDKFRKCAEFAWFLSTSQVDCVKELVFKLEKVKDITRLMDIMTFGG